MRETTQTEIDQLYADAHATTPVAELYLNQQTSIFIDELERAGKVQFAISIYVHKERHSSYRSAIEWIAEVGMVRALASRSYHVADTIEEVRAFLHERSDKLVISNAEEIANLRRAAA